MSSNYSMFTFFDYMLVDFSFKVVKNISATIGFPTLCAEYIYILLSCNHDFTAFIYPYFVLLAVRLI